MAVGLSMPENRGRRRGALRVVGSPRPHLAESGAWIEATMRRIELASAVDLAKRPDALLRLTRLLQG